MGHYIFIVDDPIDVIQFVIDMFGEMNISDAWRAKGVYFRFDSEVAVQFNGCDECECASE
jgi:hypothetical protein